MRLFRKDLIPLAKVWHAYIHANITCLSHESDITTNKARILYSILEGKNIDVGAIIATNIQHMANTRGQQSLGHPFFITKLCARVGVPIAYEISVPVRQPIDGNYIRRHCWSYKGYESPTNTSPSPVDDCATVTSALGFG